MKRKPGDVETEVGGMRAYGCPKMLTQRLKELQRYGVVHRESYHEVPPRVEYSVTAADEELLEALGPLGDWATKHIGLICAADAS